VTGTENSRCTGVPTSHTVTNTPAIPASLMFRDRPRNVPRCSKPNMATRSSVSISYRWYCRRFICRSCSPVQVIGLGVFFLPGRGMRELSLSCSENRTSLQRAVRQTAATWTFLMPHNGNPPSVNSDLSSWSRRRWNCSPRMRTTFKNASLRPAAQSCRPRVHRLDRSTLRDCRSPDFRGGLHWSSRLPNCLF